MSRSKAVVSVALTLAIVYCLWEIYFGNYFEFQSSIRPSRREKDQEFEEGTWYSRRKPSQRDSETGRLPTASTERPHGFSLREILVSNNVLNADPNVTEIPKISENASEDGNAGKARKSSSISDSSNRKSANASYTNKTIIPKNTAFTKSIATDFVGYFLKKKNPIEQPEEDLDVFSNNKEFFNDAQRLHDAVLHKKDALIEEVVESLNHYAGQVKNEQIQKLISMAVDDGVDEYYLALLFMLPLYPRVFDGTYAKIKHNSDMKALRYLASLRDPSASTESQDDWASLETISNFGKCTNMRNHTLLLKKSDGSDSVAGWAWSFLKTTFSMSPLTTSIQVLANSSGTLSKIREVKERTVFAKKIQEAVNILGKTDAAKLEDNDLVDSLDKEAARLLKSEKDPKTAGSMLSFILKKFNVACVTLAQESRELVLANHITREVYENRITDSNTDDELSIPNFIVITECPKQDSTAASSALPEDLFAYNIYPSIKFDLAGAIGQEYVLRAVSINYYNGPALLLFNSFESTFTLLSPALSAPKDMPYRTAMEYIAQPGTGEFFYERI